MQRRTFTSFGELAKAFQYGRAFEVSQERLQEHVRDKREEHEVRYPQRDIEASYVYRNPLGQAHKRDKLKPVERNNYGLCNNGKEYVRVPARDVHPMNSTIRAAQRYVEKYGR